MNMNSTLLLTLLSFALFSVIKCAANPDKVRPRCAQYLIESDLPNLLMKPGVSAAIVTNFLEELGGLFNLNCLIYAKDIEVAKVILSFGNHISVFDRLSSLDLALSYLSRKVARDGGAGFAAGTPDYKLAELYISEIKNAATSYDSWPTDFMYELIRNGHVNLVEMLLKSGYPVAQRLDDCRELANGNEDALQMLQPFGLNMAKCGDLIMQLMEYPVLTCSKLQLFYGAGLPRNHQQCSWNWLEKAMLVNRCDLATCAYENNIQLSFYREQKGHYKEFIITPKMLILHLVRRNVQRTIQSLSIVLGHKNGPLTMLSEDIVNGVKSQIYLAEIGDVIKKLYEPICRLE